VGWRPKRSWLTGLAGVAVLLLGIVAVFALLRAREKTMDKDALTVTEADLVIVRQLEVIWSPAESGAPAIFDLTGELKVSTDSYRHAMHVAEVLIQLGELPPGHYEYEAPTTGNLGTPPFVEHGLAEINGRHIGILVTESHLKLMRAARTNIIDEGGRDIGVEINPKRPYGDMSYFELDMGQILGIRPDGPARTDYPQMLDFSEAQLKMLGDLHEQMQPVLQVFLQHARLPPGKFVRDPPEWGDWNRVQ
jgi:hypothetical protein